MMISDGAKEAGGAMHSIGELQSALRKITETLAAELAQPSEITPSWSDSDWILARAVAATHGVAPLLRSRLRWRGPEGWTEFLEHQAIHTRQRHSRIVELLETLHHGCAAGGIAAVALKGAALHAMGVYQPGERPMADIDLLVRPDDAKNTAELLQSLGFHESNVTWKEREFTVGDSVERGALGEHANNPVKIELHERICEKLPMRITDATERVFPTSPAIGLNAYPSRGSLMLHLLLHAAGAMAFQALRLLHLHDLALLASRLDDRDWDEVFASRGGRGPWWVLPPLRLTARYYESLIPADALTRAGRACPLLLANLTSPRQLTDVSLSHLRIDAFPGIEWSESASLALRYVITRVRPSADHIAWRDHAKSRDWAAGNEWSAMSQGRRVLRWLGSRPVRPAALHAVRAALSATP